jgi:UDP-N-acetylmuramate-alanine ligase
LIGRASGGLTRRLGISGGTSLPGLVAQIADPGLIRRLAAQARHGVVVVTGTNGKTTTSGLVSRVLRVGGLRVWRNKEGSNLARGIATTLLRQAGPSGRLRDDGVGAFVFEVDEAAFARIATDLQPRVTVVTNLFREQLFRYG